MEPTTSRRRSDHLQRGLGTQVQTDPPRLVLLLRALNRDHVIQQVDVFPEGFLVLLASPHASVQPDLELWNIFRGDMLAQQSFFFGG